jgi:hypothetical protein
MKAVRHFAGVFLLLLGLAVAGQAHSQASRTWISGVGDDANPCSRTAPCKTFAGAISKTAGGGEINCLDPGGYGAVTIVKAITLDCGGGMGGQVGSILAASTIGIIINAGPTDRIKIRNMTINGYKGTGTSGIKFIQGAALTIEHVAIFGFGAVSGSINGSGVDFLPSASGSKLFMRDVEIQNNIAVGINIAPVAGVATTATLEDVFVAGSGTNGLLITDGVKATISNSRFAGSGSKGVYARATTLPVEVNLEGVLVANNAGQGVVAQGAGATIRMSNTGIYGNSTGVLAAGGIVFSFGNNRIAGNNSDGAPTTTGAQQ